MSWADVSFTSGDEGGFKHGGSISIVDLGRKKSGKSSISLLSCRIEWKGKKCSWNTISLEMKMDFEMISCSLAFYTRRIA